MKIVFRNVRSKSGVKVGILHGVIVIFCLQILVPLCWVLLLSIKSIEDAAKGNLWPNEFDYTHYRYVIERLPNIVTNFSNSIIVTLSTIMITTTVATLAGYALVHLRLAGRELVLAVLLGTLFFPNKNCFTCGDISNPNVARIDEYLARLDPALCNTKFSCKHIYYARSFSVNFERTG